MPFEYINPHADIPLFKAAWETMKEGFGKAVSFGAGVASGMVEITNSTLAGIGHSVSGITDSLPSFSRESAPSMEMAKAREPEFTPSAQSHHVDMAELGSFAPPSFNSAPVQQSVGRG